MIISKDEYLTHLVPRGLVLLPVVVVKSPRKERNLRNKILVILIILEMEVKHLFTLFTTGVSLGPVFPLGLSAFAIAAAYASRTAATPSAISCWMEASVIVGVADESDIGDSDNTGDGGKTAGRAIITLDGKIALYACMASIYGSSCKGEKISMSKRYLVKSFKELGELFLDIVGK
nr:hypothetical protein [Tanacetum cinerariifolium]